MIYNVGEYRERISNYFFENDEFGNVHVYKTGTMEYLDMIDVDYKYDYDQFLFICKEWINKNNF